MDAVDKIPGHLKPIRSALDWTDLIYKTELPDSYKMVATAIARCMSFNKKQGIQYGLVSNYAISRIVHKSQPEIQEIIQHLIDLGWICEVGQAGTKKIYCVTFNLLPEEHKK